MAPPKKKAAKKKAAPKKKAAAKTPAKKGRPTDFTPELGEELCLRLIESSSVLEVCKADDMPSKAAVFRWLLQADKEESSKELKAFRDQYAHANKLRGEFRDDQLEIDLKEYACVPLLDKNGDEVKGKDKKSIKIMTKEGNQFAKLMLEAHKLRTGQGAAKKYIHEVTGKNGRPLEVRNAGELSDEELADIAAGSSTGTTE